MFSYCNQVSLANQMLGKNACSLENIIQEQSTNVKMKEARNENEIFPDRDPYVEIKSEIDIASY